MALARNISDRTVQSKTGKYSSDWYKIIDTFGSKNHTEIARFLRTQHNVNPWWAQIITNRYEWERGLGLIDI